MNAAHTLELALFRQQRSQIRRSLVAPSKAFRAYEQAYLERTRTTRRVLRRSEVETAVGGADVVYVGDYHTLRQAQQTYLELVASAAAAAPSRPVVMALEFIEGRHQGKLDAFLSGALSEDGLREAMGHPPPGEHSLWGGFLPVLRYARAHGIEVVGVDRRAFGRRSLELRDAYAARRIAQLLRRPAPPRVLVLIGQYHVVPEHLPARVASALGARPRDLVVYQNCEGVYWSLARRGLHRQTEAVELRPGELCLLTASPVLCQQSFLDYLEAEAGADASSEEDAGPESRFTTLAELIARYVGVDVADALAQTQVLTAGDLDALETVSRRGRLTKREREQLRHQVLSRHSYYIPRARTAYLASTSLAHLAEEATHFVRHCCVGAAMDAPRAPEDAFYARCLEEGLGFFGSRLIHPQRPCTSVEQWAAHFRDGKKAVEKQIAAFVLAHKAAERGAEQEARKLVPLRPDRLFNGVTHALGYLLGDRLHQGFVEGALGLEQVQALFRDPFLRPADTYFELLRGSPPALSKSRATGGSRGRAMRAASQTS